MLNKTFCYLAGTGRTATHWIENLIKRSCDRTQVATFHDGFPKRAKVRDRRNASAFFNNYLLNLSLANQGASIYVECNPALLEHVALTYGIRSALSVVPAGLLSFPARGLLITRHPYAYVASLKAKGWGWAWWEHPGIKRTAYDIGASWAGRSMVEKAATAWSWKNAFFHSLTQTDDCMLLKMEHLFDRRVAKERYIERIDAIMEHFGLAPIRRGEIWWKMRGEKAAVKNKAGAKLATAEKAIVKGICGEMMERLEYG